MDDTTYEMRLANWKAIVERCQAWPEDQSGRRWLTDNGISDKTVVLLAAKDPR